MYWVVISYQPSNNHKPIFVKPKFFGWRTVAYLALCVGLMCADHRYQLTQVRRVIAVFSAPVQIMAQWPHKLGQQLHHTVQSRDALLSENQRLAHQQLLLQVQLQRLQALEHENTVLKNLLNASQHFTGRTLVASILYLHSNPFNEEIVLDKGRHDGVYVGQPVLDAKGIVGQIIQVSGITARALVIADQRSAVPVEDTRTGVRAIASGLGLSNALRLDHVPSTADVKTGDLLVSSGMGQRYPQGYPVGVVTTIDRNAGGLFSHIMLAPKAHLASVSQVILLWPHRTVAKQIVAKQVAAMQHDTAKQHLRQGHRL